MRELLLKFAVGIAFINALGQLAGSQIHIQAITQVFVKEIGIYLFAFIIFGLVTGFNLFLLDKKRGVLFFMVSSWVTAGAGLIYLNMIQTDVATQEALTLADVQPSLTVMMVSVGIFLAGSLVIPLLSWPDAKS